MGKLSHAYAAELIDDDIFETTFDGISGCSISEGTEHIFIIHGVGARYPLLLTCIMTF